MHHKIHFHIPTNSFSHTEIITNLCSVQVTAFLFHLMLIEMTPAVSRAAVTAYIVLFLLILLYKSHRLWTWNSKLLLYPYMCYLSIVVEAYMAT